jgi:hypothetical protein
MLGTVLEILRITGLERARTMALYTLNNKPVETTHQLSLFEPTHQLTPAK